MAAWALRGLRYKTRSGRAELHRRDAVDRIAQLHAALPGDLEGLRSLDLLGREWKVGELKLTAVKRAAWNPRLHPRDRRGRFARKPDGSSVEKMEGLLRSGLPDFGPWQRSGTTRDRTSGQVKLQARAAALAKQEVATDLARRMSRLSDEEFLDAGVLKQLESLRSGDMVLLRKPGKELAERQKPDSPILPNPLTDWDYRWLPRERYEARIATDPDAFKKIGGEVVDANEFSRMQREAVVSRMVSRWAWSSNDSDARALALQEVARELFELDDVRDWPKSLVSDETLEEIADLKKRRGKLFEEFLKAQYEATQERLAEAGITEVVIYRGVIHMDAFESDSTRLRPLSSFTFDKSLAEEFASLGNGGGVMSGTIPAERILSIPRTGMGALSEAEVVVLGGGSWTARESL